MYEVLKFIEHGDHCRQSLDCVQGKVLLGYLRNNPQMKKEMLFRWFKELAVCVDQFHRCRKGQDYRFLNPYSIVVSEEERLMLLDMEAPDNSAAARQMQKGAVREHFVKPVYKMGVRRNNEADLFGYGKTIQFMLACTEVFPALSRWEEIRLEKLIGRCIGEKKRYENMRQVIADLPTVPKRRISKKHNRREGKTHRVLSAFLPGTAAFFLLWAVFNMSGRSGRGNENLEKDLAPVSVQAEEMGKEQPEESYVSNGWDGISDTAAAVGALVGEAEDVRGICETLRFEAEMLQAYERLLQIEEDTAKLEEIGIKKMELEAKRGDYEKAIQTGESVLEKTEESEEITALMTEFLSVARTEENSKL